MADPDFPAELARVKAEIKAAHEAALRADPGMAGRLEKIDRKMRAEMTAEEYAANEESCDFVRKVRAEMRAADAIRAKRRQTVAQEHAYDARGH